MVDVHGYVSMHTALVVSMLQKAYYIIRCIVAVHIGVGFCVARSTEMGNARASIRGTGDESSTFEPVCVL